MKKIFTNITIIFVFAIAIFAGHSVAYATSAPTCTISFTPAIVKQGENSVEFWKTTGPLSGSTTSCDGVLKYIGGYTSDYTTSEFLESSNAQEIINGTSNSGQVRPSKIGKGSCTLTVRGPGGTNSCSATIEVIPNEIYESNDVVVFENPVTFHLIGNEKVRACPIFSCGIANWGTFNGDATIKKKQGDWYFVSVIDHGEKVDGQFMSTGSTDGWLHSDSIPNSILDQLKAKNPSTFEKEAKSASSTTGTAGRYNFIKGVFVPLNGLFNKKEVIYPILTVFLLGLLYLTYRLFSKVKFSALIVGIKSIRISWVQFVVGVVILSFTSFGWFGFILYQQTQNTLQEIQSLKISQKETFAKQQGLLEQQSSQLQQARANENATKQALQELQNRPVQTNDTRPTGAFLTKFSQSVVKILCFADANSDNLKQGTGVLYMTTNHSGLAPFYIQTNLHVVETDDNSISSCIIVLYPDYSNGDRYLIFKSTGYKFFKNYIDTAFVKVEVITDTSVGSRGSTQDLNLYAQAESETYYCSPVDIGTPLSVFGYPAVGGNTLTVTDGIISGVETDNNGVRYYKTSAKIDHGNSGGIAIGDSGCVIGVPTFVQQGELESIGRILDLKDIFNSLK
ncbi:MAG: serine protease [bacterium]|nr:serine protease [bacterium]